MAQITINSFQQAIELAQAEIDTRHYLGYQGRCRLMDFKQHNPAISNDFGRAVWVLTEVLSARLTLPIWQDNTQEPFITMPKVFLNLIHEQYLVGNTVKMSQSIWSYLHLFLEDLFCSKLIGSEAAPYFDGSKVTNEDQSDKVLISFYAFQTAILSFSRPEMPLLPSEFTDEEWIGPDNPALKWSVCDYDTVWAADWAAVCSDLSPKEFWSWYVGECFPAAVEEALKLFKKHNKSVTV